uniref:Uncharacterized protein n=1 Tax=Rhipicephalus pulchellus TaxID=72859 RepID=L7LST8_RHIPC
MTALSCALSRTATLPSAQTWRPRLRVDRSVARASITRVRPRHPLRQRQLPPHLQRLPKERPPRQTARTPLAAPQTKRRPLASSPSQAGPWYARVLASRCWLPPRRRNQAKQPSLSTPSRSGLWNSSRRSSPCSKTKKAGQPSPSTASRSGLWNSSRRSSPCSKTKKAGPSLKWILSPAGGEGATTKIPTEWTRTDRPHPPFSQSSLAKERKERKNRCVCDRLWFCTQKVPRVHVLRLISKKSSL